MPFIIVFPSLGYWTHELLSNTHLKKNTIYEKFRVSPYKCNFS